VNIEFDGSPIWCPLFRLYAYALLRGSHIFTDVELSDESLEYDPFGFMDVWKGNYHGDQVCIKAIRMRDTSDLEKTKRVRGSLS